MERSTLDSIKPDNEAITTDGLDLDDQKLVEAVGKSYIQFGKVVESDAIGFEPYQIEYGSRNCKPKWY